MEPLKIVGSLLLSVCGVWGAQVMNRRAIRTVEQIEGWLTLLRFIRSQVDCYALPISRILGGCDRGLLSRCGYQGEVRPEGMEALLDACEIRDEAAEGILWGFVREFGKGYREEQLRSCEYYLTLLSERRDALAAQLPMKKRVTSTLWISGALATVILLV